MWVLISLKTFFGTTDGGVSSVAGDVSVYSVASDFSVPGDFSVSGDFSVAGDFSVVSRSQTAIFSFILGREKIGSGTPPIEKAVLASTAIGVGDYWQWLLCNR